MQLPSSPKSSVLAWLQGRKAVACSFGAACAVAAVLSSCVRKEPALGQLMVTVLTDAPLPDYVDGIRLQAFREHDGQSTLIFDREPEVRVGAGELLIPTTLAVVTNGRSSDRIRLKLQARKFGKPRVLREAVTQVPGNRIVELHLPIEWLCDGSAEPGDPMYCSDPEYTCAGGRCIPQWVDPATLPTYLRAGNQSSNPLALGDVCFDVPGCFAGAAAVPLTSAGCSVPVPNEGLASYNLALVVNPDSGGQCLPGGNCLVTLSRGPLGWDVSSDGARIMLPPAVCTTKVALVSAVVATRRCATKGPSEALCGAWSPFVPGAGADAGADASVADASVAMNACSIDSDCGTGSCLNGECCESSCGNPCYSCTVPGKEGMCVPLLAGTVDRSGMCKATPATACGQDGTCDGNGSCRMWALGTGCGTTVCAKPSSLDALTCDGRGSCIPTTLDCSPFQCWPGGCLSACDGNTDCVSGFYCGGSRQCLPQLTAGQACTAAFMCASGSCVDGVCCDVKCDGTCSSCALPGAIGKCTTILFGDAPAGECPAAMVCNGGNACVVPPVAKLSFDNEANLGMVSSPFSGVGVGTMRAGTALNSPAFVPATRPVGVRGQALSFDGINQHVTFPASAALDRIATTNQFTVAAWVRVPAVTSGDAWVISRHEDDPLYHVFGLGL